MIPGCFELVRYFAKAYSDLRDIGILDFGRKLSQAESITTGLGRLFCLLDSGGERTVRVRAYDRLVQFAACRCSGGAHQRRNAGFRLVDAFLYFGHLFLEA